MRISNRTLFSTGAALFALSLAVHADVILTFDSRSVSAGYSVTTPVASGNFTENIDNGVDLLEIFHPLAQMSTRIFLMAACHSMPPLIKVLK